tara:strand:- start:2143 stop:2307 length:165 start_codon:yes stop_codon:yes gene_type:complete
MLMKAEEVLRLMEKHELESNRRFERIEKQLERLDMRLWGIAALIVAAAIAERFL